ncbi:hypothetical protein FE345_00590 [Helicobacter pylori]|nr:hypothetical protein FE345_00590 [Helicobacter pylori]
MWCEKFLKVIPAVAFLFCLLEILELALIINGMNKTEKLEAEVKNNLNSLNKYFEHKKINIKQCNSI